MKWLVWLLLMVNVALFGYFRLAMPLHVDAPVAVDQGASKIRIVSAEELAAMAKPALPVPPVAPQSFNAPPPVAMSADCYEWGSFSGPDALRVKGILARLALEVTAKKHTPQEAIRYWVYIPPLKTLEAVQAKAAEIRQLGIEETFIIQEPKWRNAISLGVFRDEALANKFLEDMRNRGVNSAIKGQRNLDGEQTGYFIKNMTPAQQDEIDKLKPEFPGSDLKLIDCK